MYVPNAEQATVAPEKVTRYLLDAKNPRNGGKATFFFAFGFTRDRWGERVDALREHVRQHEMIPRPGDRCHFDAPPNPSPAERERGVRLPDTVLFTRSWYDCEIAFPGREKSVRAKRVADSLFPSELPEGEGLRPGDEGVVVDALHAPTRYTVEFFRGGETVAIADVTPAQVRVVARATPDAEPSQPRHAD